MFIAYLTLQHRVTPKLYLLILLILTGACRVFCILRRYFPYDKFMRDTNFQKIFSKRYENRPRLKD